MRKHSARIDGLRSTNLNLSSSRMSKIHIRRPRQRSVLPAGKLKARALNRWLNGAGAAVIAMNSQRDMFASMFALGLFGQLRSMRALEAGGEIIILYDRDMRDAVLISQGPIS